MRATADSTLGLPIQLSLCSNLALQVTEVYIVEINDTQRADARRGQVQRGRRAQAACADQQYPGSQQLELAFLAHIGQQGVAAVANFLVAGQHLRDLDRQAGALPAAEAADQRLDVFVAHFLHVAGRQRRAHAASAVEDDGRLALEGILLDAQLQKAARDEDGARHVALLELVALADVHHQRLDAIAQPFVERLGRSLDDLAFGQGYQLVTIE